MPVTIPLFYWQLENKCSLAVPRIFVHILPNCSVGRLRSEDFCHLGQHSIIFDQILHEMPVKKPHQTLINLIWHPICYNFFYHPQKNHLPHLTTQYLPTSHSHIWHGCHKIVNNFFGFQLFCLPHERLFCLQIFHSNLQCL